MPAKMLTFAVFQFLTLALAQQSCYFPDGSEALDSDDLRICNPNSDGQHSSCCLKTGLCMSNGLCLQQSGWGNRIARSGCTDSTWTDSACAQVCKYTLRSRGLTLYLASEDENGLGHFCCGTNYDESTGLCNGTNDAGDTYAPLAVTGAQVLLPNSTTPIGDMEQVAVTTVNSSTATSSSTASSASTTSSSSSGCSASASSNKNDVVAVGAGVGASLGVAFLVASGLFFWQWRRNKHLISQLQGQVSFQPKQYGNGEYTPVPPSYGGTLLSPQEPKSGAPNQELAAERPMSELPDRG